MCTPSLTHYINLTRNPMADHIAMGQQVANKA